ncbi:hypothetical protein [Roseateles sp.]|uniref:hypothetical protein n=1 Tax=Roseateles sp. TaxID=1971397 RepID=UPI0031DFBD79
MTAIYDAYKPLRNYLRTCDLSASLVDTWRLSQHVVEGAPPPNRVDLPDYTVQGQVFPWDLPSIAREVVLHAQDGGRNRLNSLTAIAKVVNPLRRSGNEGSKLRLLQPDDIFDELLRISHQQFPWQQRNTANALIRHLKTFGSPRIAPLLQQKTGLTAKEFFFLGLALSGHLSRRWDINADQDYAHFGITRDQAMSFFGRLALPVAELKKRLSADHAIDARWDFIWNALEATPLIALDPSHPNRLHCPVPALLLRRFSGGLYYDLIHVPAFGDAFGRAFEDYIGEVIDASFPAQAYKSHEEVPYYVGKARHDGPDWIVSGEDANLFVECKTKRLTQLAKSEPGNVVMRDDIGKIADAIVQHYRNVLEAQQGLSKWTPNGLPCVPLVVTFEDWFFLGPQMHGVLAEGVRDRLGRKGMDVNLPSVMPYAVMSAREFESCCGTIAAVGIKAFFEGKKEGEYAGWMWEDYSAKRFPGIKRVDLQAAFWRDWSDVIPAEAMPREWRAPSSG